MLFETEEIPPSLGLALDLCGLDLETLLDNMLVDFDLAAPRHDPNLPAGVTQIRGTLKAGRQHPRLRSMAVIIDDRTKLVRRVVLSRVRLDQAVAEVSFDFQESRPQADDRYRLAGHLVAGAAAYASDQPILRRRELVRLLGSLLVAE